MKTRLSAQELRSWRWFGPDDLRSFGHRSRARQMGLGPADWEGKPVIAILNTWSEFNPCHLHFKVVAENVKRGILQAGGLPLEIPVLSVSETFMKPSPMLYRNLLAMETEEVLRSQPADGAILLGACDKTPCKKVTGAAQLWAQALTHGSIGPNAAQVTSRMPSGAKSRTGLPDPTGTA